MILLWCSWDTYIAALGVLVAICALFGVFYPLFKIKSIEDRLDKVQEITNQLAINVELKSKLSQLGEEKKSMMEEIEKLKKEIEKCL